MSTGTAQADIKSIKHSPEARLTPEQELYNLVQSRFGEEVLKQVKEYFSTDPSKAYLVTHNGNSADCWANAVENDLFRNNRSRLAVLMKELIEDNFIGKEDFFSDPLPDGSQTIPGQKLGSRKGMSLAFDLGVGRKFNATYGANDFQVEAFERWAQGQDVSVVYNGIEQNGQSAISKLLKEGKGNSSYASGVRFSLTWDSEGNSQHMSHVVTVDRIAKDQNGQTRVYFYQSLNLIEKGGPDRDKEGNNFESMSLEDFKKNVRVAWVPADTKQALNIARIPDPAYYTASESSDRNEVEKGYLDGKKDIYAPVTAEILREMIRKTEEYNLELDRIRKTTQGTK